MLVLCTSNMVDDKSVTGTPLFFPTGKVDRGTKGVTQVGTFEVCVPTHVTLRIFIMQVLASQ